MLKSRWSGSNRRAPRPRGGLAGASRSAGAGAGSQARPGRAGRRAKVTILLVGLAWAGALQHAPAAEPIDDARIEGAIRKAKEFLWSIWDEQEGHWPERGTPGLRRGSGEIVNYGGRTALCAYALLAAGERYQERRMRRTLEWLRKVPMHGVYAVALRANVWGQIPGGGPYRRELKRDLSWLVRAARPDGSYTYTAAAGPEAAAGAPALQAFDNSNSQMAVLGVWSAAQAGLPVPKEFWQRVENHWRRQQNADGGWGYGGRGGLSRSYASMTAAGLATMFITFDNLHFQEFVEAAIEREYAAITRGLEWMSRHYGDPPQPINRRWKYYRLYGVERVGLASGFKFFGKRDWYREGVAELLRTQRQDGSWPDIPLPAGWIAHELPPRNPRQANVGNRDINTAFALLFLARGRHPILFNKLRYEGSWNTRPRDLANLSRWMSRTFEKQVNWQVIDVEADVEDWHDAPILYISGKTAPEFTAEQIDKLRTFVHQGGVIFSEAVVDSEAFTEAMKSIYAKMFPRLELKRLPADHPIYNLHFKLKTHPELSAVSNGCRLLAIHCPRDVSRAFQLRDDRRYRELFEMAANLYFFVTDRGSLRHRGVSPWPRKKDFIPERTVTLAILKHSGRWNPEPLAWERFAILMGNRYRVKVDLAGPMDPAGLEYPRHAMAVMTGTSAFALTDAQKRALRAYCRAGGTLVLDAAGGSQAFREAAAKEVLSLLPEGSFEWLAPTHPIYTGDPEPVRRVRYRRALRVLLHGQTRPRLRAVMLRGRPAILFSAVDITAGLVGYPCWGLKGYEPDSAFALLRNIVFHVAERLPAQSSPATAPAR